MFSFFDRLLMFFKTKADFITKNKIPKFTINLKGLLNKIF